MKKKNISAKLIAFVVLLIGAVTMLLPFLWMISTSLKKANLVYTIPPQWIPNPFNWQNYADVWTASNLLTGIKNSAVITMTVFVICILASSMAAFAFAKLNFPKKNLIFSLLLCTMMVPIVVLLVPQFIIYAKIGWIDTLLPLFVPLPIVYVNSVFFLRQYMTGLPNNLLDASKIDGCGYFRAYWKIFLPLSKAAILANTIMLFMFTWNDYIWPLVFTNSASKQTVQVAIAMMNSHYAEQTNIPLVMTASLIAILPVLSLFMVFQKHFTESFVMTGIKG